MSCLRERPPPPSGYKGEACELIPSGYATLVIISTQSSYQSSPRILVVTVACSLVWQYNTMITWFLVHRIVYLNISLQQVDVDHYHITSRELSLHPRPAWPNSKLFLRHVLWGSGFYQQLSLVYVFGLFCDPNPFLILSRISKVHTFLCHQSCFRFGNFGNSPFLSYRGTFAFQYVHPSSVRSVLPRQGLWGNFPRVGLLSTFPNLRVPSPT